MRLWVKCLIAVVFSALLTSTPSRAEIPSIGETIDVSIVNVDVVVTDKSGKRVRGLKQGDFEILQDSKAQPITNFAEYGADVSEATVSISSPNQPRPAAAPRQTRTLVVFVDRFSLRPFDREPLFAGVKAMLHEVVRPGDAVMVVSWRNRVITRLPFTDDVAAIDRTLDQIERESMYVLSDRMAEIEDERSWLEDVSKFASEKGFSIDVKEEVPLSGRDAALRARFEMRDKVRSINGLISAMSGIDGKKVLMLMTSRFSRIAGKEFLIGLQAEPGLRTLDEIENDMSQEIESVVKAANANGVTIYPFYPQGLDSESAPNAARRQPTSSSRGYIILNNELEAMSRVADETGGVLAWGAKNIVATLPSVEDDFDSYYSLAYRATGSGEESAHRVAVRVKNRSLKVRARRSFVEKSDETKMKDRVIASLIHEPDPPLVAFEVNLGEATRDGRHRYRLPVSVRISMHTLMTLPAQLGTQKGGFSVYVGWGGVLGEMSEVRRETREFTIEPDEEGSVANSYLNYEFELLMDEKTDRVVVGVVDEVSHDYGVRRVELPPRSEMLAEK